MLHYYVSIVKESWTTSGLSPRDTSQGFDPEECFNDPNEEAIDRGRGTRDPTAHAWEIRPRKKVRIVLEGLRGEQSISELCRREEIASNSRGAMVSSA